MINVSKAAVMSNVRAFLVSMGYLRAHINALKIRHHDLKSFYIWPICQAKQFLEFSIFMINDIATVTPPMYNDVWLFFQQFYDKKYEHLVVAS